MYLFLFLYIYFKGWQTVSMLFTVRVCVCVQGGWCWLPAMCVSVRFRLALADLGLLILEKNCEEEMVQATIRSRMSSTERAVDEYLRSTADLNDLQRVEKRTSQTHSTT